MNTSNYYQCNTFRIKYTPISNDSVDHFSARITSLYNYEYTLTNVFSPYLFKHKRHLLKVQLMNILQIKQISSKYICVLIFYRSAFKITV